ncbi:Uncharacterized protein Fot_10994 [Forsythia ovata]|uniref:Uncharacterized protein n=1 Tax=Forsythia ovata TaxID=205694 RepID=A0ABD1WIE9_9LAMI
MARLSRRVNVPTSGVENGSSNVNESESSGAAEERVRHVPPQLVSHFNELNEHIFLWDHYDISVDRDNGLYLLSMLPMSGSNFYKAVTSKDTVVVESSKDKLEKGTRSSLRACKGDKMNKHSEKRTR